MSTATKEVAQDKLDGVTIDAGLKETFNYLRLQADKDSKTVRDPNTERNERIRIHAKGLEKIVDEALGDSVRANHEQAGAIVNKLAYELAKSYSYTGKPEDLPEERKAEYLTRALSDLGIPGINTIPQLVENIMNMAAAKSGHTLYDANSPLARLLQHIASRKDDESARMNYLFTLIAAGMQHPDKAFKIQDGLVPYGIGLKRSATGSDLIRELQEFGARQTREYVDKLPKTYKNPSANLSEYIAEKAKADATGPQGRN